MFSTKLSLALSNISSIEPSNVFSTSWLLSWISSWSSLHQVSNTQYTTPLYWNWRKSPQSYSVPPSSLQIFRHHQLLIWLDMSCSFYMNNVLHNYCNNDRHTTCYACHHLDPWWQSPLTRPPRLLLDRASTFSLIFLNSVAPFFNLLSRDIHHDLD